MAYSNIQFELQRDQTNFPEAPILGMFMLSNRNGQLLSITFLPMGNDTAEQTAAKFLPLYNANKGVFVGNVQIASSTSDDAILRFNDNTIVDIPFPTGLGLSILINTVYADVINVANRTFVQNLNIGSNPIGRLGSIGITNMGPEDRIDLNDLMNRQFATLTVNTTTPGGTEVSPGLITALGSQTLECLLKGTKILTPTGETLIENLQINDIVLTADGREVKIIDIVNSMVSSKNNLYVIHKDKISQGVPNEDLFISGGHVVKIHDKFYHPVHNKTDLIKKCTMYKTVHFYNIKLENYLTDNLVANGVEVESLGDAENPEHTNWDCSGDDCKLLYKHQ